MNKEFEYNKEKCNCCRELTTKEVDGKSVITCKIFPKCEYSDHYRTPEEVGIDMDEMYDPHWFPYSPPN